MTQSAFTLPLSRWHHVAERFRTIADSKSQEAFATLGDLRLTTAITDSQRTALKLRGTAALDALGVARQATRVVGDIRRALADANAKAGVTALLATTESKRKERQLLAHFSTIDLVTKVGLDEVNAVLASRPVQDASGPSRRSVFGGEAGGVAVSAVRGDSLDFLQQSVIELDAEIASLTDQAADLNRAPLTITLPVALAKVAGL